MAGRGAVADPNADRPRSPFGWVDLPADGREGPIPSLPTPPPWMVEFGGWPVATREAWASLWRDPAATMWDQTGKTLHGWALLHAVASLKGPSPATTAELRQHEDRHGLSPRALLGLRWRVVGAVDEAPVVPRTQRAKATGIDRRSRLLKVVADVEGPGKAKGAGKA